MSLAQQISKSIDEIITTFISQVSVKYDISEEQLLAEWNGKSSKVSVEVSTKVSQSAITEMPSKHEPLDHAELLKYKKPELQALCKQRGLKSSATKEQLINFLLGKNNDITESSSPKPKNTKSVSVKSVPKPAPQVEQKTVVSKLTSQVPTIPIRRNQFGNYEFPETSFVFDKKTQKVIGKQNDNGKIDELSSEDIDICNQYKFKYDLPENLEKKSKLSDEKVEELDEESEEEIVSEDEVVLEEELIEDIEEEEEEEGEEYEYAEDDADYV